MIEAAWAYTDGVFWDICYGMLVVAMLAARFLALLFLLRMAVAFLRGVFRPAASGRAKEQTAKSRPRIANGG